MAILCYDMKAKKPSKVRGKIVSSLVSKSLQNLNEWIKDQLVGFLMI